MTEVRCADWRWLDWWYSYAGGSQSAVRISCRRSLVRPGFQSGATVRQATESEQIRPFPGVDAPKWPCYTPLCRHRRALRERGQAEVAEPADALRSGRSARKGVGVQISPSAPALLPAPPGAGCTLTSGCMARGAWKKDGRWRSSNARGKSELHRAGCLAKAREAALPPTVQIGASAWLVREQQRPGPSGQPGGVKRAILPAAISEPADKDGGSPRSKVESSHEGDDVTGPAWRGRER